MKLKTIIITPLLSTICAIILNAIFHAVVMAAFFDQAFAAFGNNVRPIKETNPALLSLVEATWVCSLFYFLTIRNTGIIKLKQAIIGGMLINAVAAGTWNFINLSMFTAYPASILLPDMAWHILFIAPVIGSIIALLYNKLQQ